MKVRVESILIIIAAILFGLMPLVVVNLYEYEMSSNQMVFWRYLLASIIILPWVKFKPLSKEVGFKLLLLGVLGYGMTTVLLFASFHFIPSSLAMILHFLYPFFVVVGGVFFKRPRPSRRQIVALLAGSIGIFLMLAPGEYAFNAYGIVLAIISAITYAFSLLMLEDKKVREVDVTFRLFCIYISSTFVSAVLMVSQNDFVFPVNMVTISWLLFLALGCSIVAIGLMAYAVPLVGATNSAILSLFEPLTGVVVGIAFLAEEISFSIVLGMAIVLISGMAVMLNPQKNVKDQLVIGES